MQLPTLKSFVEELEKIANVYRDIGEETAILIKRLGGHVKARRVQDRIAVKRALEKHDRLKKGLLLPAETRPNNPT